MAASQYFVYFADQGGLRRYKKYRVYITCNRISETY